MKVARPVKVKPEEKEAKIDDTSAVPDEPKDHAVTRGRDVSLRCEGGHSPENHTVALECYWNHRRTAAASKTSQFSRVSRTRQSPSLPSTKGGGEESRAVSASCHLVEGE